jgi:hypothetical protein
MGTIAIGREWSANNIAEKMESANRFLELRVSGLLIVHAGF